MAPLDLLDIVFALYEFNQEAFTETEYTVYLLKSGELFVVSSGLLLTILVASQQNSELRSNKNEHLNLS